MKPLDLSKVERRIMAHYSGSVLSMTDDQIRERIRQLPQLAKYVVVSSLNYQRTRDTAASMLLPDHTGMVRYGQLTVIENNVVPDNVLAWLDSRRELITVTRLDDEHRHPDAS